jgi:hypothetical protein
MMMFGPLDIRPPCFNPFAVGIVLGGFAAACATVFVGILFP